MNSGNKLYGVGVRDIVAKRGCEYYRRWANMLMRCYDNKFHSTHPNYVDCFVCDDWLTFSKFKAWMEKQDWEGKVLEKDILILGNKVYSPETCVFVSQRLNNFVLERNESRGEYPLGVSFHKPTKLFRARCNDENGKQICIGLYNDPLKAHDAWREFKNNVAICLAEKESDQRIKDALMKRYEVFK